MYDENLACNVLEQIHQATNTILTRFQQIKSARDFTDTPGGMEKLDSICMLLIAIGESLKNIDKITSGNLLPKYPQVDWKKAKGLRDIISHHYFEVDAEAIFYVCNTHIPSMEKVIRQMISEMQ